MKHLCLLVLSLCMISNFSAASMFETEGNLVVASASTVYPILNAYGYTFMHFFKPDWVSREKLEAEFVKAADQAKIVYPGIQFCKADLEGNKKRMNALKVTSLPAVKFFEKGNYAPTNYNGGDSSEEIMTWLRDRMESLITKIETIKEFDEQAKENQDVVLFIGSSESRGYEDLLAIVSLYQDITFLITDSDEIKDSLNLSENSYFLSRNYDQERNTLDEFSLDLEAVQKFINTYRYPTVTPFTKETGQRIYVKQQDAIFVIRQKDEQGERAEMALRAFADEFRGRLIFTVAYVEEDSGKHIADFFELKSYPAIAIVHSSKNNQKYKLDREISEKNIRIFLSNFFAGNLRSFYRSQPLPEVKYDGDIKIVIGKTYHQVVNNPDRDVLIEFYSPTCSHCQNLAPHYAKLASTFKHTEDLLVAKIDGSKNDVVGLDIPGFPMIFFYTRDSKAEPVKFEGKHTLEGLIEFVKEHSTASLVEDGNKAYYKEI